MGKNNNTNKVKQPLSVSEKIYDKTPRILHLPLMGVFFWLIVGEMVVDAIKPKKTKK